jgi:demethoxyubiquinone hydroxylase (CLK1/Coq7/Cat5 family)
MPDTVTLLQEIAANCEAEAEKQIELNACILSLRRRIRAALDYLAQDKPDEAKHMLQAAMHDNGELVKRRLDKVMKQWVEDGGSP